MKVLRISELHVIKKRDNITNQRRDGQKYVNKETKKCKNQNIIPKIQKEAETMFTGGEFYSDAYNELQKLLAEKYLKYLFPRGDAPDCSGNQIM